MNTIKVEESLGIRRITLHRPQVRNAFDEELIAELTRWVGPIVAALNR